MGTGVCGEHLVATNNMALRVENVSKRFSRGEMHDSLRDFIPALFGKLTRRTTATAKAKDFWALQNVSFELNHGEAFGIIGANGAGKSTILKLITGIMKPTSGNIEVNGRLSALIKVGA